MTSPVPDEVPVADAIEQSRGVAESVPDRESPDPDLGAPPLEVGVADWQEQAAAATTDDDDLEPRG